MTGMELFEGLSFVDERFIQEAETAKLGRNTPWLKVLSVAACLCILFVGAFAMGEFGSKGATEAITEEAAAAPAAMEQEPTEAAAADKAVEEFAVEPMTLPAELYQIPYARLKILCVLEEGSYEAIVEETDADTNLFEAGQQVSLIVDPAMIPPTERTDTTYEGTITEDRVVEIRCGTYDAGINTLYVEGVIPTD